MEENQRILFEGEVTYTLQAIKEHRKHSMYFRRFLIFAHIVFSLYLVPSLLTVFYPTDLTILILIIGLYIFIRRFAFGDKTTFNRMLSGNQGEPVHSLYHFGDSYIHTENPLTGNQYKYQYSQIVGLAQTRNYFVLLIKHNQYMLLGKNTVTGGTIDDFTRFLCENCPNLKPKKLRSNTFGKIVFFTLVVILGLSLISFLLSTILLWFEF